MTKKLLKSTAVVGGLTLISRILGFIRDMVIAYVFGASTSADAFFVAFKIPNFMRRLFGEGAFSQAFIPVISEYKTQRDKAEVKHLVNHVAGHLGGVLLLVTVIGIVIAPLLVLIFAPGFFQNKEKYDLTIAMLQITFPYLLFIALTAFAGAVLNTYGQFAVPALTPVLLNVCMIGAALWIAPSLEQPVMALAYAVFFAGLIQLAFQLPFLHRLHLLPKPSFKRHDEGVSRIYRLMLPALFGVSVSQINLLIDTLMASFLVTGSISWLYYSDRLMEFPLAIFGLALATVMLPDLSKSVAQGDMQKYSKTLDWALRWLFLILIPSMLGLIILAAPILTTLFHNGEFSDNDVIRTSHSLIAYSVGLVGFVLIKVLASGFYSRQDTRTPVKIAVIAMVANMVLNLILIWPLAHAGLALATSLAALLNAGLLYRGLRTEGVFQPQPGWRRFLLRIAMASGCMVLLLWWGSGPLDIWLNMGTLERALHLSGWIVAALVVYFASLVIFGFRLHHVQN
ncbi:MAG: murein biosynthesis integral membrane protein MurJ [Pseudomonadota bacterium]